VNDDGEEEMMVMLAIEILHEKTFQIMGDREPFTAGIGVQGAAVLNIFK
jgi:hypothetical protein